MEPTKLIQFFSGDLPLEGLLDLQDGPKAVVITHPHPLYGGDMHNVVVDSLARAYKECGFTCLRFNFRGVGDSKGLHDEGNLERDDVLAAFEQLKGLDKTEIHVAGYSFGAWVVARTTWPDAPPPMVLIAPPSGMLSFQEVTALPSLGLVVVGANDEYAPPESLKKLVPAWNPQAQLVEIPREDHLFFNQALKLEAAVIRHLNKE